jgi:DNA-binding NarL/FixJ family response regulator
VLHAASTAQASARSARPLARQAATVSSRASSAHRRGEHGQHRGSRQDSPPHARNVLAHSFLARHIPFTRSSALVGRVQAVTRIAIVDPQPAVRAGLTILLRAEPGLVPVGSASGVHDGVELVERLRPAVVLLERHLLDGDGLSMCRRLKALPKAPRVILYTSEPDGALVLLARVACADGLVDKAAEPAELFEAIRVVARGATSLPPLDPEQMDAAAHVIDPEDLALLAMLADGTSTGEVAETLRLDRRRVGRRIERMLGRLRSGAPAPV